MKILMISGKAGSGKDTIAKAFKEEFEKHNKKVLIIHFGDPVKFFAKEFYNWDGNKDESGRNLLQYVGTSLVRATYPRYWGELIGKFINAVSYTNDYDVAIIADWRFENEYKAIKQCCELRNKIYTIRIDRFDDTGYPYVNPNMTKEQLKHISETELDNYTFEYVIRNDSFNKLINRTAPSMVEHFLDN